jgi:hypothetical protein
MKTFRTFLVIVTGLLMLGLVGLLQNEARFRFNRKLQAQSDSAQIRRINDSIILSRIHSFQRKPMPYDPVTRPALNP